MAQPAVSGTAQWLLAAASDIAARVDVLFFSLLALTGAVAIAIFVLMIVFSVRYRAGSRVDRSNPPTNVRWLELGWTFTPLAIFLGIFVWAAVVYARFYTPAPDAMAIFIVGKQWMWKAEHANGRREIDELHLPAGPRGLLLAALRRLRRARPGAQGRRRGGHGARRVRPVARARQFQSVARRPGFRALPAQRLQRMPCRRLERPCARPRRSLRPRRASRRRPQRRCGRGLSPRFDPPAQAGRRRGLPADHAELPGTARRRRARRTHFLPEGEQVSYLSEGYS